MSPVAPVCHSPPRPGRLRRVVSSWRPSSSSSCWWGTVLLWTAAGSAHCPASIQSWPQTPPKLLLPPPLLLLSSRTRALNHPHFRFWYSHPPQRRDHHLSGYCVKSFLQVDELQSHTALYLQSLLHHLSQDVHPVCCSSPLPELLSSPKSPSTLILIPASKTLSNSFSTWLSSVMPMYFPGSCTSPFLLIFALSGPSSTPSVSFPPAYTHSVAFLSTWHPPLQPSPSSLAVLHLPLSPCLFHIVHCCFYFFLSYLLHFHFSPLLS